MGDESPHSSNVQRFNDSPGENDSQAAKEPASRISQRSGFRRVLTHPLTLACVPVVGTIIVAVIALVPKYFPGPEPPSPSPSPTAPLGHQGGVAFRVDTDVDAYRGHWAVAFDGPLPPVNDYPPGKPTYAQVYTWMKARGALDVGVSHLRLLLQNNGSERVTIRSISAKVIQRLRPVNATYVQAPSAGTNDLVDLGFDLDSGDLVAAQPEKSGPEASQADTSNMPFFSTKDVTLDSGESTDIKITTRTALCHCSYRFEVEMVKPDSTDTLDIADIDGHPFAITAQAAQYTKAYEEGLLGCGNSGLFRLTKDQFGDQIADCGQPA